MKTLTLLLSLSVILSCARKNEKRAVIPPQIHECSMFDSTESGQLLRDYYNYTQKNLNEIGPYCKNVYQVHIDSMEDRYVVSCLFMYYYRKVDIVKAFEKNGTLFVFYGNSNLPLQKLGFNIDCYATPSLVNYLADDSITPMPFDPIFIKFDLSFEGKINAVESNSPLPRDNTTCETDISQQPHNPNHHP